MKGRGRGGGMGQGSGGGSGMGSGSGGGGGTGGGGRMRGGGMGAAGMCICAKCGGRIPHQPGVPCMEQRCPECGATLVREGSEHHRKIENRQRGAGGENG